MDNLHSSSKALSGIAGKTAIVTGGATLIGAAVAQALCEAGANVVIADIDTARGRAVAESFGSQSMFVETDLGQLPVVAPQAPDVVLGLLDRRHVFTAYSSTLAAIKAGD